MNRYLVDGWVPAPKRKRRGTGTYYHLQVYAPDADGARLNVKLAFPKIQIRSVALDPPIGGVVRILKMWQTED